MNKKELNELIKKVDDCDSLSELKAVCYWAGLEGFLDKYLTDDEALAYIKDTCSDMERLYYCTREIKDWDKEYYYLDNYSNLENAKETLYELKQMVIEELENKLD